MIDEKVRRSLVNWALNELTCDDVIPDLSSLNNANVGKFLCAKDTIIELIKSVEQAMVNQTRRDSVR